MIAGVGSAWGFLRLNSRKWGGFSYPQVNTLEEHATIPSL
jgi:hypothetical protein